MTQGLVDHRRPFRKMHGLGNDFVIFDARAEALQLTPELVRAVADRRRGVGCDQVIVMRLSDPADVFMEIWNSDGGEVAACGNATRCIARILMDETGGLSASVETKAGIMRAECAADGQITVDMGAPKFDWQDIPLAENRDTNHLNLSIDGHGDAVAVNMGNPHVIFFENPEKVRLEELGPALEKHELFPMGVNVSFAGIEDGVVSLRVWERGAGLTDACGTAAAATVAAAHRRGLIDRQAVVQLPGGSLAVGIDDDGHVHVTGPAETSFEGLVDLARHLPMVEAAQ